MNRAAADVDAISDIILQEGISGAYRTMIAAMINITARHICNIGPNIDGALNSFEKKFIAGCIKTNQQRANR